LKKLIVIFIVVLLMVPLVAATPKPEVKLHRLTIVNKSGGPVDVHLVPLTDATKQEYYLSKDLIKSGDRDYPYVAVFTVQSNLYELYVYFWDDDGNQICVNQDPRLEYVAPELDMGHNQKITIIPCDQPEPKQLGEFGAWKYWYPGFIDVVDDAFNLLYGYIKLDYIY